MSGDVKKYQVVSNGEVLKGFSILEVAEVLGRQYKISPASAIDTLICGRPRKVRSARSKAHADSICAKLQSLGLSCGVSEIRPDLVNDLSMHTQMVEPSADEDDEDDVEPLSESADEAMASIDAIYKDATSKVAKSRRIKQFSVAVIALGVMGFGSWFGPGYWLTSALTSEVAYHEQAMTALGSPSVIAFADLAQARKLSKLASLTGQKSALKATDFMVMGDLFQPLVALKKDSFFQQSAMVSAAMLESEGQLNWIITVSGDFSSLQVDTELRRLFNVMSFDAGLYKLSVRAAAVTETSDCTASNLPAFENVIWYVSLLENAMVLSSSVEMNQRFESTLADLKTTVRAPSARLQQWQSYRENSVLSVKVYDPKRIKTMPPIERFVSAALPEPLYDELSFKVYPQRLNLGLNVEFDFTDVYGPVKVDAENALITSIDAISCSN